MSFTFLALLLGNVLTQDVPLPCDLSFTSWHDALAIDGCETYLPSFGREESSSGLLLDLFLLFPFAEGDFQQIHYTLSECKCSFSDFLHWRQCPDGSWIYILILTVPTTLSCLFWKLVV